MNPHVCAKRRREILFEAHGGNAPRPFAASANMKTKASSIILGSLLLQLLGCADFAGWVRQYTYPPTFHYISTEQLRSTMWRLAYHSREVNQLLRSTGTIESHRKEILEHLEAMARAATELNRTGWPSNHPLIDENRSNFLRDIKMAGDAIRSEPPNFLLAGSVTGACVYCHGSRSAND
jgi:hypothetical protein